MLFFIFAVFIGGKYLYKNFSNIWFHVGIDPLWREFNHCLARFLNENGNSLNLIASLVAPFILNVSQTSRKLAMWAFGSSSYNISNMTNYCAIWIILGLISKLLVVTVGLIILDLVPFNDSLAYSCMVLWGWFPIDLLQFPIPTPSWTIQMAYFLLCTN